MSSRPPRQRPRLLMIPTHPGVQYHFTRVGLPTYFLGHWDQFKYWRPQEPNVINVLPEFRDEQLEWGPGEYAALLDGRASEVRGAPEHLVLPEWDLAWLMFNWQVKLFWERPGKKLYRVAKVAELEEREWDALLSRDDFSVVSFYPNTVAWLREKKGVEVPYVPLGLDPAAYGPWTGHEGRVLSIIHTYQQRGWHYRQYLEAMEGLPALHVDHLDEGQDKISYEGIQALLRSSRVYLHDGEQEYTITLIEALMTGMPIVSFRIPGIERYVIDGKNGFVCDTAARVRECCRMLLADDTLAAQLGKASRDLALAEYAEATWRERWIDVLDRTLSG